MKEAVFIFLLILIVMLCGAVIGYRTRVHLEQEAGIECIKRYTVQYGGQVISNRIDVIWKNRVK